MNSTDTDRISAYVDAVRAALADLPESARDEMIDDLHDHLTEVAAEHEDLVALLGSPESYAAELRTAAGFVGGFPDPPPKRDPWAEFRETAGRRLGAADRKLGPVLGYARISEFLMLLRPAWWVLRGYLAAMVLAWMLDDSDQSIGLLPRIGDSEGVAVVLAAGAIVASIWLGRRTAARRLGAWPRYALYAGSFILVLVAVGGFLEADGSSRRGGYTQVDYGSPYSEVQDVFVYDDQGRLVEGARLFDQNGAPIRLGEPWCPGPEEYSESVEVPDRSRYPYCPERAPFRLPSAEDARPSEVPAVPSGEPVVPPQSPPQSPPVIRPTSAPVIPPASPVPSGLPSGRPR